MKGKILLLSFALSSTLYAQKVTPQFNTPVNVYQHSLSIPRPFSYNDTPMLTFLGNEENANKIFCYDENIDLVKTISLNAIPPFEYELEYENQEREVSSVTPRFEDKTDLLMNFEQFLQHEQQYNPDFQISDYQVTKTPEGDSLIIYTNVVNSGLRQFFNYPIFGLKYPYHYWRCTNGNMYSYRTDYVAQCTPWKTVNFSTVTRQLEREYLPMVHMNLNTGEEEPERIFTLSQTLFNTDEKMEYIIPKFEVVKEGSYPNDVEIQPGLPSQDLELKRSLIISEKSQIAMTGIQIVSEDGTILRDLDFGQDMGYMSYSPFTVLSIGQKRYLVFETEGVDKKMLFYEIDNTTTSIDLLKTTPTKMNLRPRMPRPHTPLEINFSDPNKQGSQIVITNAAGQQMMSTKVKAGQSSIQLRPTLPAGNYVISRIQNQQLLQTEKFIVR